MQHRRLTFFVLSLIPIFLLLLTMVRFTPITMSEVMTAVLKVFPESVAPMIRSIVSQVYFQSGTIVPVTIVVALWSAGKGVLSVTSGLNSICENMETRNYFLSEDKSIVLYSYIPIGYRKLPCIICIRKQDQRDGI